MNGEDLFEIYVSKHDEYAGVLCMARTLIGEKLLPMLESCEKTGKKIEIKEFQSITTDWEQKVIIV